MLIDSLAIQTSAAVASAIGSAAITPDHLILIETLKEKLVATGWSYIGDYANGSLLYPLGFPTVSPGGSSSSISCSAAPFASVDGVTFVGYNPYNQTPVLGSCVFFAFDTTEAAGLNNLCSQITATTQFTASWTNTGSRYLINIVAKISGPLYNYRPIVGDGRWGIGQETGSGGYTFTSVSEAHTAQYTVKVTATGRLNPYTRTSTHPVYFDFTTPYNGAGDAVIALDTDGSGINSFEIIANPYSFAIYDPTDVTKISVFAAALYVPDNFVSVYALIVMYPTFRGKTYWASGGIFWLGNAPETYVGNNWPRLLSVRAPGTLIGPLGMPVISSAWIMYGRSSDTTPAVVGKLWDCCAVSATTNGVVVNGTLYRALASQGVGTAGGDSPTTLAMRSE